MWGFVKTSVENEQLPEEGRSRVIVSNVLPELDGGRFPIKRVVGESVIVEADIFTDGHDVIFADLLYRMSKASVWQVQQMSHIDNDRWRGGFRVSEVGCYEYTIRGWIDRFGSWRQGFYKKALAGTQDASDCLTGAEIIEAAARRAVRESQPDSERLLSKARLLKGDTTAPEKVEIAMNKELVELMRRYSDRRFATMYRPRLKVVVDRKRACFSAWYEFFPRSCAPPGRPHGTFKDCHERLSYAASMGFDIVYFPPIHPIGRLHRKGKNNSPTAEPDDPGSPWAIGAAEGGHKDVHPELGSLQDFRDLVDKARQLGMEVALDIAFQCAPDHPYVKAHPEWFQWRPDGSVQYAENPPKKYEDIYPFDFETDAWHSLWDELKSVVTHWAEQGVRVFRVDNPHTKPFPFWQWLIEEVKSEYPDALFLSEAFTRPKVMYHLAKLGFTQSYTYFAWRNTKQELMEYGEALTGTSLKEYLRPNFWPNTPDILTEYLQMGGRPAFIARLVLAATLSASYGIYGPAFELCESAPAHPYSEEYLNSEKYEIKDWPIDQTYSLREFVAAVNRIRKENEALQSNRNLRFHIVDNEELIVYTKHTDDLSNIVLVVVNLDPHHTHHGWMELPLEALGLDAKHPYQVHDLISDMRYLWHGKRNYVRLDPDFSPAHIFRLRRRIRTERDFDYFM